MNLRNIIGTNTVLSQMIDAYTGLIPMACAIEVKHSAGNMEEATIQYRVWAAAGLAKLKELFNGATLLQPLLGWTVVGHKWTLYISWKLDNGEVVVYGPWDEFRCGTGSYKGIFKLLHLIGEVGKWLETEYWTWFRDSVLSAQ